MKIIMHCLEMIWMLVMVLRHTSPVSGTIFCNVHDSTINCAPNSTTSRPWTLCEILFPSQTSCPGEMPRTNVTKLLLGSSGLHNVSKYTLHRLLKLEVLDLRNNSLSLFPRTQTGWLPNSVSELNLGHNHLQALPRYAFRGLVRLATLCLNNNQISTLSAGTFAGNSNLKVLDLSFNRLEAIATGAFQWLRILTHLKLNNNFLKTLSRTAFSDLTKLKVLSLKNNFLTIIPGTVLKPLGDLETLTLKNNFLHKLDISTVVSLNQISFLDVSLNFLSFDDSTFLDGSGLRFQRTMIIVVSSKLTTLKISSAFRPSSALPPFVEFRPSSNSLVSLDVAHTNFARCSLTFLGLDRLKSLNINGGDCIKISDILFDYLPNLRNLSMSRMCMDANEFYKHSGRLFNKLGNLEILDLSRNDLYSLDSGMLRFQTHLKILNLTWNRFRSLPLELVHLPELSVVDLSHNVLITLQPHERLVVDALARTASFNLDGNLFSCACSNADFFLWWSTMHVRLMTSSSMRRETIDAGKLHCLNESGDVMSVMQALENCPDVRRGLFDGTILLASLCPLVLVLGVMIATVLVKSGYCKRRCQSVQMQTGSSESFTSTKRGYKYRSVPTNDENGDASGDDDTQPGPQTPLQERQHDVTVDVIVDVEPRPQRRKRKTSPVQTGQGSTRISSSSSRSSRPNHSDRNGCHDSEGSMNSETIVKTRESPNISDHFGGGGEETSEGQETSNTGFHHQHPLYTPDMDSKSSRSLSRPESDTLLKTTHGQQKGLTGRNAVHKPRTSSQKGLSGRNVHKPRTSFARTQSWGFAEVPRDLESYEEKRNSDEMSSPNVLNPATQHRSNSSIFNTSQNSFALFPQNPSDLSAEFSPHGSTSSLDSMFYLPVQIDSSFSRFDDSRESLEDPDQQSYQTAATSVSSDCALMPSHPSAPCASAGDGSLPSFQTASFGNYSEQEESSHALINR